MKNKLHLVIFSSALHDNNSVMGSRLELFEGLRRFAELDIVYPSMLATAAAVNGQFDGSTTTGRTLTDSANEKTLCFIATGGTEEIFRNYAEVIPHPVLLLRSNPTWRSAASPARFSTPRSTRIRSSIKNWKRVCSVANPCPIP